MTGHHDDAVATGVVVMLTGFNQADPIATLLVVLMVKAGWGLLRDSTRILLEAAPAGLSPDVIAHQRLDARHIVEIHDLHLWSISSGQPALSTQVLVGNDADCHQVRVALESRLAHDHRISHTTLRVDHAGRAEAGEEHCPDPHGSTHRGDREHRCAAA